MSESFSNNHATLLLNNSLVEYVSVEVATRVCIYIHIDIHTYVHTCMCTHFTVHASAGIFVLYINLWFSVSFRCCIILGMSRQHST
jgi:hypothetical protein